MISPDLIVTAADQMANDDGTITITNNANHCLDSLSIQALVDISEGREYEPLSDENHKAMEDYVLKNWKLDQLSADAQKFYQDVKKSREMEQFVQPIISNKKQVVVVIGNDKVLLDKKQIDLLCGYPCKIYNINLSP